MTAVALAESDAEIARCFSVMAELRTHLDGEAAFVAQVKRQREEAGYALAFVEEDGAVVALAGFRVFESFPMGRGLYVDDLVTTEGSRSRGHGERLMDWLVERARTEGCVRVHLDSGVQRAAAHRFYFRTGMHIRAYHFDLPLG